MTVDNIINDITNRLANDGSADYIKLTEQVGILKTISETLLGLIVTIVIIGIPLIVVIELSYINIPILQDVVNNLDREERRRTNRVIGLVLRDARLALSVANTVETGRDVNFTYLKIKVKSIIIAMVAISIALGLGPAVLDIVVSITTGIINGIKNVI